MNGYLTAMRRYAAFRGRASRAEFWQFTIATGVIVLVATAVDSTFISGPDSKALPFAGLVALAHVLPGVAVAVRRLHDVDRSGWFLLINLIPLIGFVLLLYWACEAGTRGPNGFGPDSRGELAGLAGATGTAVATSAAPAPPMSASRDVVGELERLATLHSAGRLSDAEFATLKARALSAGDAA